MGEEADKWMKWIGEWVKKKKFENEMGGFEGEIRR